MFGDYTVDAVNADFDMDQSRFELNGGLAFSNIPLTLNWSTHLNGVDKGQSEFTIDGSQISAAHIIGLGYKVSDYMQGSLALKTTARLEAGGVLNASVETNLKNTDLSIPQINWHKAVGEEASVGFGLLVEKGRHVRARDIKVELGSIRNHGQTEFEITGSELNLSMEQLFLHIGVINGLSLERSGNKGVQVTIQGGELNIESLLAADQFIWP